MSTKENVFRTSLSRWIYKNNNILFNLYKYVFMFSTVIMLHGSFPYYYYSFAVIIICMRLRFVFSCGEYEIYKNITYVYRAGEKSEILYLFTTTTIAVWVYVPIYIYIMYNDCVVLSKDASRFVEMLSAMRTRHNKRGITNLLLRIRSREFFPHLNVTSL